VAPPERGREDRETAVAAIVEAEGAYGLPFEARKAQAVVTRSYLAGAHNRHQGFDFCDTEHCQLLKGLAHPTSAGSRANPVIGVNPSPSNRSIGRWFDPAAFTTPAAFTWGTLGRNSLNAPSLYNFDFSLAKKFRLAETRELQFRSEFFNGLNHPQFGLPNATIGVADAGTITSTQRSNRQMQFALRLAF
jgi:hypothetical protein